MAMTVSVRISDGKRNTDAAVSPRGESKFCQCEQCGKRIPKSDYDLYGCVCSDCAIENL